MIDTFRKLRDLLDTRERRNAVLLFCMMLVMGILEAVGVASIMPFIAVVANPEIIHDNRFLAGLYDFLGYTSTGSFLFFLGLTVFVVILASLGFKVLTHWAMSRYTHMRSYSLSRRLLSGYLDRPYTWFLSRDSADISKAVLLEVDQVIIRGLIPAVTLVANGIVACLLVALIVAVNPAIAVIAVTSLGGAYALIYFLFRQHLGRIGVERWQANQDRFQVAQEAVGGIKDIKVLGLEQTYIAAFNEPARRFAHCQSSNEIVGKLPRFLLEALAFGGMIVIILFLLGISDGSLETVLPLVALYAFSGYRLMPALQQIYQALTNLRFGKAALEALHQDLLSARVQMVSAPSPDQTPIRLADRLELQGVYYAYPQAEGYSLKGLTLRVEAGTSVALVGSTGAGKTTALDVLLGLLTPQRGEFRVDDIPLGPDNIRAWQRSLGYVPQHIFLSDDSVAANIAFGVPPENIDIQAVERAARVAQLHDFVVGELPQGYGTMVGERGVRLSGGQRQRIGIARALYHDPEVLLLDEATSALDNRTEHALMTALRRLGRKTVIMVAHRLTTVQACDTIFMLEDGAISESGTYQELLSRNAGFRALASVQKIEE
jgi:ABC-type bacteriocin/lantibiotic exporter with double-glycine peptidase domain